MTRSRFMIGVAGLAGLLALLAGAAPAAAQTVHHVSATDPTCGGQSPCHATIQAAVTAAQAGDTVRILPGTYVEQLTIADKNNTDAATEADRIVIEAAPAAPVGSVVLAPPGGACNAGEGVRIQRSRYVTLRGLTITGAVASAVRLFGGNNQNRVIHLERLRVVANGTASCAGGISIQQGNPDTLIANSLIHANHQDGIAFTTTSPGGLVGNTIRGNTWNGVSVARNHDVVLVNNAITGNGTASGTSGGRAGVRRDSSGGSPNPAGIQLLHNLVCGNRLGELDGPILDATDAGNLTPAGTEGPGVSASPGCDLPATVYDDLAGPDGLLGTGDDDVTPAETSPLLDAGTDPRTLGFPAALTPLVEADYLGADARPRLGVVGGTVQFDIGAIEATLSGDDEVGPEVTILAPPANSHVRLSVPVEARATDEGSGVVSLTLKIGSQPLPAVLNPSVPPPAPSVTATATWDTTAFADGLHTLRADAEDDAGNPGFASHSLVVDNTPPETEITGGPTGTIAETSAVFTFNGSDNLTGPASLVFAWRLDGGPWSAFSAATSATVTDLGEGPHTFEVKTRDLAGNEDPTPAVRSFAVGFGPSIAGVDPLEGPIGTFVTITGGGFVPGATTVTFNGTTAPLYTVTATSITTTVPVGATTGPLAVTTGQGAASVPFTVTLTGDFTLTASPAAPSTVRIIAGDEGFASILADGTGTFTSLVSLSVSGAPAGVATGFSPQLVARGAGSFLGLAVGPSVAPGTYALTVTGQAQVDAQPVTRMTTVQLEVLPPSTQAITGRVLTAEAVPEPIPGVTVTLGTAFTLTDDAGNFVLLSPPAGANMLLVDGRTASTPEAQYPPVEIQLDVAASGPTRVPFILYLPRLDTANAVSLPLDATGATTQPIEATTPRIPGLVVTIPQGTTITGPDGNPVSQITITPVPVDRTPMPFPPGVSPPMLFTIQPGGAVPSSPLPITFPNLRQDPPGEQNELYFFDLVAGAWDIWGQGTVSEDSTQVVSHPGAGLPRFAWHANACGCAGDSPGAGHHAKAADPVDLVTGRFVASKTDLVLPGRLPVVIERSYRSGASNTGLFGTAWTLETYDSRLLRVGTSMRLITGDQASYLFTPAGTGQWVNLTEPAYQGAVITQLPGDFIFQIRYKDGTVHRYDRIFGFANLAALAHLADRYGNAITVTREQVNQRNKITRITEPGGRHLDLEYDTAHRIIAIRDPINREVRYTYDGQGRLETVIDAAGGVTRYTYDAANRITAITDPRDITYLTNEYDAAGRVIRQGQADGGEWTFAYAFQGATNTQTVVTDPRGHATTHRFDSQGFTLSVTDALGQTTAFEYAPGSNLLLAQVDPLGRRTAYTYDAAGNVTSITRLAGTPGAVATSFTYEPTFHNLASITNPLNHTTTFGYDAAGNLTTITDPLSHQTTLTYNTAGQPLTITTPAGTTTLTYANGELVQVTDPLGNTTTRGLDGVGRLVSLMDPRGRITRYHYDVLNQLTHLVDAVGGLTRLAYDPNGNLLSLTDARGNATSYTYDAMDRLEVRTDPLLRAESYVYDPAGNVTGLADRKGQVTVSTYDPLGRLTHVAYADASTTSYAWDAAGRLTQVADSIAGTLTRAYDDLDRLVLETTPNGAVSYTYDAAGRRTSTTVAGQPTVGYGYDAADRLSTITQAASTVTFAYDAANRRTSLTLPNAVKTEYAYDVASRLTGLTFRNESEVLGTLTYTYDAAGNRVAVGGVWARTGLPQALASATYDAANRQLTFGSTALTYDLNGNLVDDGTTTYAWDARDRLAGLGGAATASFVYDALGRRQRKTINGVTADFVYDGLNPVLQGGGATVVDLLTGLGIDEFFSRTEGVAPEYLLADALGSTVALVDAAGAVLTEYSYEPFGVVTASGASSGNELRYTGREDDGTGLYYYRARHYHPTLQRFITEDPLGFQAGDPNLYAYVGNNPLNWTDPWGLRRGDWWDVRTYTPDLARARVIAAEVLAETQRNFPGARLHNDAADAWRHARWSSRMVNEIGWGTAVIAGYGHELENLYEQWRAGQPIRWDELWMDLHNNREGRSGRDAWRLLAEGRLRITPIGSAAEYGALRYGAPGPGASGAPALSGRKSMGYANSSY